MVATHLSLLSVQRRLSGPAVAVGARARGVSGALGAGFWKSHVGLLFLVLLFAAVLLPHHLAWAQAAGAEWTTPAGTVEGTRFSSLAQIDTSNVSRLKEEFHFNTGVKAGHQGAPLVVGSTMYVVGPFPNKLFALDLTRPGQTRWVFDPRANEYAKGVACCDIINRGAVFANGKIIYNVLDNTTVAVDAVTGRQVWRTKLGDPHTGQTMVMGPLVVRDKVFVGNSGAELGLRGWVAALDVNTGREVWRAWSTGPDTDVRIGPRFKPFYAKDKGTNLGVTTWPGTLWQQGGATVWAWLTYDPQLNLLFEGTANPGTWNPDIRPGDNKWSSTIFARDPDTGEAIWAYQTTPHDAWDFDSVNESIVVDLPFNGVKRKLLVHFNKNGFAYTMDRATGQVLVAEPFVAVNWADRIDLATGLPAVNPAKIPHEGVVTKDICPAPPGGKDMEPAAFSPMTGLFYIPGINLCVDNEPIKVNFIAGTPFVGASTTINAGPGGDRGELIAWNAVTGKKAWGIRERFPVYSGVLTTAGNLVFYGTMDRWFRAVDATTGHVLFETQLESGIVGSPMTFTGPDGKQRVAVYAGVGGYVGAIVPGRLATDDPYAAFGITAATKDLPQFTPAGGAVHVFKLP
jgi:lanthanide-dependent methanol dehydrogenase